MTTFALVHGSWHGGWCFERLVPELESRGHAAVAVDLPCDDLGKTYADYAQVVAAALAGDDDVVAVGHSMGGHTIPYLARLRPVRRLVFLCALLPEPDGGWRHLQFSPGFAEAFGRDELDRSFMRDAEAARATLYNDCDPEDARAAFARLRPQARAGAWLPRAEWADVPATYVVTGDDRALSPEWQREAAAASRLPTVELDGGHSPFLARPEELALLLLGL
jgi:pimeloyl-ACP methyl ester carboxylesterase